MEVVLGNRYYLGRKIGSGAFGTIYEGIALKIHFSLGECLSTGLKVAIKMVSIVNSP